MSLKGLERAIQNLNSLSRLMVPTATAQALNRVAGRTITQGSRKVAKEATVGDNRKKGLPVRLVRQRSRLKRAKPDRLVAAIRINRGNLPAIKLGAARVHRLGKSRYPIDVVKVPLETPLTQNFTAISKQLIDSDMPKELSSALKNQLRIHLKR